MFAAEKLHKEPACYLCGCGDCRIRPGSVRDNPDLDVYECKECGLVFLSSFDHAVGEFYEDSGMHGEEPLDIGQWIAQTKDDDERRFRALQSSLKGKSILDFGCGTGGFLLRARSVAEKVYGVELERRLQQYFRVNDLAVFENVEAIAKGAEGLRFDVITMFHVLEHLPDPKSMLSCLAELLTDKGELIIEVPHADDALLSLYECESFSHFTYWSCHLYLFTVKTLELLVGQAGIKLNYIKQVQRYPISNHLYWLAKGKPGGHKEWGFLDSPELQAAYEKQLAAAGKCDTLVMSVSRQS
ncbi:MAG: class I SAM-dependent methyltransferase [Proteobacteria bacterium]|nr:class I SAM-dependent methyltransferase [Pseudomonadota bacterium]MBU1737704.1 class I SAM-dependent methyltransferase [Pseudomonadota bacterium]